MRQFISAAFILLTICPAHAQDVTVTVNIAKAADPDTATHVRSPRIAALAPVRTFADDQAYSSLSPMTGDVYSANTLQLDIDYHMNSNALTTTFGGAFLTNNNISPDMINRALSYARKDIKYEDDEKAGLSYNHFFKKPAITIYASYYTRNMRQLTTSHDAFAMIFEGNAPFENKTASLSDITFNDLMYNQYSIGISKSAGHFFAGINVSYLQGFVNQQIRNPSGSLYTAPYGEYLDVAYDLTFNESNPVQTHFFDLNGQGVSADMKFGYSAEKWRISLTVQDLGYISWRRNPINYRGDTSMTFNGIVINDLTDLSGSGAKGINIDSSLSALEPHKSNNAYHTLLPATIQATFSRLIRLKKHDMILSAGVNTRLLYHYYAYGYVKTTFLLDHNWATSVSVGAGGYSLCNLGWDIGKRWRNLDFLLGTSNLVGCIVPMYYPGSSFYLRVAAHF